MEVLEQSYGFVGSLFDVMQAIAAQSDKSLELSPGAARFASRDVLVCLDDAEPSWADWASAPAPVPEIHPQDLPTYLKAVLKTHDDGAIWSRVEWVEVVSVFGAAALRRLLNRAAAFHAKDGVFRQIHGRPFQNRSNVYRSPSIANPPPKAAKRKRKSKGNPKPIETADMPSTSGETQSGDTEPVTKKRRDRRKSVRNAVRRSKPSVFVTLDASWPTRRPRAGKAWVATKLLYVGDMRESLIHRTLDLTPLAVKDQVVGLFGGDPGIPLLSAAVLDDRKRRRGVHISSLLNHYLHIPPGAMNDLSLANGTGLWVREGGLRTYLTHVWRRLISPLLLGPANTEIFIRRAVTIFTELRRKDTISLDEMGRYIKESDVPWAKFLPERTQRHAALRILINYLSHICIKSIRASFYLTEGQEYRHRLLFFRKPIWARLRRLALAELHARIGLRKVAPKEAPTPFGIRLIPRKGTMRPVLANPPGKKVIQHMRWAAQTWVAVLDALTRESGTTLLTGSSTRAPGVPTFVRRWTAFSAHCASVGVSSLAMVKTDLSACYDRIRQPQLLALMAEILAKAPSRNFWVQKIRTIAFARGRLSKTFRYYAWPEREGRLAGREPARRLAKDGGVVFDDGPARLASTRELLQRIRTAVTKHHIALPGGVYRQTRGIAQGSPYSVRLCDLFLGRMERDLWSDIMAQPDSCLLRYVDDILLLTPNIRLAHRFLDTILSDAVEKDFGMEIRPKKTLVNFPPPADANLEPCSILSPSVGVSWCGVVIEPGMRVRPDFSRVESQRASDSVSWGRGARGGQRLRFFIRLSAAARLNGAASPVSGSSKADQRESKRRLLTWMSKVTAAARKRLPRNAKNHAHTQAILGDLIQDLFPPYRGKKKANHELSISGLSLNLLNESGSAE